MKPGYIRRKPIVVFLLFALSITLVLAFVDEGKYNFDWVREAGSWIAFLQYVLVFLAAQIFVYKVVLDRRPERLRLWLTPPIATGILLLLLLLLIWMSP